MKGFLGGMVLAGAVGVAGTSYYKSELNGAKAALGAAQVRAEQCGSTVVSVRESLAFLRQDNRRLAFLAAGLPSGNRSVLEERYDLQQIALAARATTEGRARENARERLEYRNCIDGFRTNPTVGQHISGRSNCGFVRSTFQVIYDPTDHRLKVSSQAGNPPYEMPAEPSR